MTARSYALDEAISRCVEEELAENALGAMIYGSVARGTAGPNSDIDVLQLHEMPRRPFRRGSINVSVYTPNFLSRIAKRGSLFVLHLRHEGIIIADPKGQLKACLQSYVPPTSYECFRTDLSEAASLLDVDKSGYRKNWRAYNRLGLFLLRSQLFSEQAESGSPIFSVTEISELRSDHRLRDVYRMKYASSPNWEVFCELMSIVEEYLGCVIRSPCKSVEALMLEHDQNEILVSLGYRLIGKSKPYDFYAAVREQLTSLRNGGAAHLSAQDILSTDT